MVDKFLSKLHEKGVAHDSLQADRSSKLLNITPETGAFLALLLQEARPRRILEIGTSNGYSTIWLARSSKSFGAKVVSVDSLIEKTKLANGNLAQVGLADAVELVTMDAGAYLTSVADRAFDFLFLDASRSNYVGWWPDIRRALDWGMLVVDNAVSHENEMRPFLNLIRTEADLDQVVLPVGKGQLIITRQF